MTFDQLIDGIVKVGVMLSPILLGWFAVKQAQLRKKQDEMNIKVEEYHKEVNGKMSELLKTTKELGNAEGKAEEKEKNK